MKKIENLIVKAVWDPVKKKWKMSVIDHDKISPIIDFDNRTLLLNYFGEDGWAPGGVVQKFPESNIRTEIYEYILWRPKQKQKRY